MQVHLSLVVPCYNEEETIPLFYEDSIKVLSQLGPEKPIEFIFVDDGSKDKTLTVLRELSEKDARVHYISFSRNFGKEAAMLAGFQAAQGEFVVTLDADGQHPPSLIPQMLEAVRSGEADCAGTKRTRKGDPKLRSFFARQFYKLIQGITGMDILDGVGDFRLMNRKYLEAVLAITERSRFSKGIFPWIGFKLKWFEFENIARSAGSTKWSFWKLFLYSLDGIIAFSSKPLAIASVFGIVFFFISIFGIIFVIIQKFLWNTAAFGWPSTICIILFCSGINLFTIGILGQYIAKIHTEIKQRPHYIIKEAQ